MNEGKELYDILSHLPAIGNMHPRTLPLSEELQERLLKFIWKYGQHTYNDDEIPF